MRFIHISDVHLGRKPDFNCKGTEEREEELYKTFEDILNACNNEKIDLLLIAGELFDKQPLNVDLIRVNDMFKSLVMTKVVLVAGSKDYLGITSNYYTFSWNDNVHIFKEKQVSSIYLEDINTRIYGFSFNEKYMEDFDYSNFMKCGNNTINIFVGYGGEERYAPMDFKKLLGYGFDYVALGSKHNYEKVCDNVVYSGTPEPLGCDEQGNHGYVMGEIIDNKCIYKLVNVSRRQYIDDVINITPNKTSDDLIKEIDKLMIKKGRNNIYSLTIEGYKNPDIEYIYDSVIDEYNIVSIIDNSLPNYDFQMIYEKNNNNMLGMYIDRINNTNIDDEIKKRALYLGVEALIKQQ